MRKPARGSAWLNLSANLANQRCPSGLEVNKCDAHLQEGPEGASGELQACQPDLGAREGHGTGHLGCCHVVCAGHDRALLAQFVKGKSCLTHLISFCDKDDSP